MTLQIAVTIGIGCFKQMTDFKLRNIQNIRKNESFLWFILSILSTIFSQFRTTKRKRIGRDLEDKQDIRIRTKLVSAVSDSKDDSDIDCDGDLESVIFSEILFRLILCKAACPRSM